MLDANAIPDLGLIAGTAEFLTYLAVGLTAIVLIIINIYDID